MSYSLQTITLWYNIFNFPGIGIGAYSKSMNVIYESVNHSNLAETFNILPFQKFAERILGQILQFDNSKTIKSF